MNYIKLKSEMGGGCISDLGIWAAVFSGGHQTPLPLITAPNSHLPSSSYIAFVRCIFFPLSCLLYFLFRVLFLVFCHFPPVSAPNTIYLYSEYIFWTCIACCVSHHLHLWFFVFLEAINKLSNWSGFPPPSWNPLFGLILGHKETFLKLILACKVTLFITSSCIQSNFLVLLPWMIISKMYCLFTTQWMGGHLWPRLCSNLKKLRYFHWTGKEIGISVIAQVNSSETMTNPNFFFSKYWELCRLP